MDPVPHTNGLTDEAACLFPDIRTIHVSVSTVLQYIMSDIQSNI